MAPFPLSPSFRPSSPLLPDSLIVKFHFSKVHSSSTFVDFLSHFLISLLKKRGGSFQQLKNISYLALRPLLRDKFLGVSFRFSGRVFATSLKSNSFKFLFGSVPFSSLSANIDFSKVSRITRNGT